MAVWIRGRYFFGEVAFSCGKHGGFRCASASTTAPSLANVDARHAPAGFDNFSAVVYNNMVAPEEGESLAQDVLCRMKRRRYERGHWDAVITNYKEIELADEDSMSMESQQAMRRIRNHIEEHHLQRHVQWLPSHAIDLRRDTGELKAHVDSVRFSGGLVAGLSLLSPSIMRLKPESSIANKDGWVDMFLPPLSLYVITGMSRYEYTHELLPTDSNFLMADGTAIPVQRDQRLSIIFRDAKEEGNLDGDASS